MKLDAMFQLRRRKWWKSETMRLRAYLHNAERRLVVCEETADRRLKGWIKTCGECARARNAIRGILEQLDPIPDTDYEDGVSKAKRIARAELDR